MKNNMVGWFEIPVVDMDRAIQFYETVFEIKIGRHEMGDLDMGWFPMSKGSGAMGSLVYAPNHYTPSAEGSLLYLTAHSGDVAVELARVEGAGGKVLQVKTLISEDIGYMALFLDTEGNRLALHSSPQK